MDEMRRRRDAKQQAAAHLQLTTALERLQTAQTQLELAAEALSTVPGMAALRSAALRVRIRVKALWYKVEARLRV